MVSELEPMVTSSCNFGSVTVNDDWKLRSKQADKRTVRILLKDMALVTQCISLVLTPQGALENVAEPLLVQYK